MTTVQEREVLLAELNGQNKAAIGPVLATGSIAKATERADGTTEATVRILQDALVFEPAIQILPHADSVELTRGRTRAARGSLATAATPAARP